MPVILAQPGSSSGHTITQLSGWHPIEALRTPDPTAQESIPLEIRKKAIEAEIENIMEMGAGARSEAARKKAQALLKNAEAQLSEIEEKEKILTAIKNDWQKVQDEIHRFEHWCQTWVDKLESALYADKRTCIEYLGIRVNIFQYGSKPRMTITFAPPNIMKKLSTLGKKVVL